LDFVKPTSVSPKPSRPYGRVRRFLTDLGHPIAVITPIKGEGGRDALLQRMAEQGLITVAARKGSMPTPRWRPVKVKGKPVSQTIVDDREETA
jgi:hypothetical protein